MACEPGRMIAAFTSPFAFENGTGNGGSLVRAIHVPAAFVQGMRVPMGMFAKTAKALAREGRPVCSLIDKWHDRGVYSLRLE